jgi:formylglycine-generating enzyme required for sulfatase activity
MIRFHFVTAVAVVVIGAACTRFAFRDNGRGTAPSELSDRSTMVRLDGGPFQMGLDSAEPDEFPEHRVTVSGFLMDRTEVTVAMYGQCIEQGVCAAPRLVIEGALPSHPVVGVSWYDAQKYCTWTGKRLPSEAEWEFAARHPHFGPMPWEGKLEPGRLNERGEDDGFARTAPVGSFPGGNTATGLQDMAGNAAEWTADWYDSTYYKKSAEKDPKGPEGDTGTKSVRGGSWSVPAYRARSTARTSIDPNASNDAVGFRCAASL